MRDSVLSLFPGLVALSQYKRAWLRSDLAAGLSVAAIALPVGIAYADLAGVPAVVGMYSAIFPLFAYALFGSSRQLMTGPDAATCIIVAASLSPLAGGDPSRYATLLMGLTVMTGVLFVLAGTSRLGFIANFLSQPILTGYLNGIALLIIVGQLPKLFGYSSTAESFVGSIAEFIEVFREYHWPTMCLGAGMIGVLLLSKRYLPRLPGALIAVLLGLALVAGLDLDQSGVVILGEVPKGWPALVMPSFIQGDMGDLFGAAAGLVLVSFTSGVLTAKSFARRNGYEIDANRELIGFGACNLASGLAQGFPVTGADSRTAVNNAMGGKTQLVGVVAGATMLIVLMFLTAPLAYVPTAALAAVILISAIGLFDLNDLRTLFYMSRREFMMSVATTVGVLVFGVLPGVLLAVILSLAWLLSVGSRPHDAVLGRVPGMKGFHDVVDYPQAKTIPGLLLYRFDSNLVFYNAGYFKRRILAAIDAQQTPVEWFVLDGSTINVVDVTGLRTVDELRQDLASRGISTYVARGKIHLDHFFTAGFARERRELAQDYRFETLKLAIRAFRKHKKPVAASSVDSETIDADTESQEWSQSVEPPRPDTDEDVSTPIT